MHIGRLSAQLTPGVFVVEDLMIEGLTPQDRPFLTAKKITVEVPWWTMFSQQADRRIGRDDRLEHGRRDLRRTAATTFPKFTRKSHASQGPSRFTTTLRSVRGAARRASPTTITARRGAPSARDLDVTVYRPPIATTYHRPARRSRTAPSRSSRYEPFRADMQSRFTIDNGIVHFDHMDLSSDGSRSAVTGDVDLAHWPEQTYQIRSKIDFPTQKGIFFHGEKFTASGQGDFEGTFHLFKGGRELKGTFTSPVAGVNAWRFPNLRGSVRWVPDRLGDHRRDGAASTAAPRSSTTGWRRSASRACRPRATWDVDYKRRRPGAAHRLPRDQGHAARRAARRAAIASSGRSGSGREKRGGGEVTHRSRPPACAR